ncbi:MAG: hypothetical protein AAF411_09100 [Myxococcota bacterium]
MKFVTALLVGFAITVGVQHLRPEPVCRAPAGYAQTLTDRAASARSNGWISRTFGKRSNEERSEDR